MDKIICNPAAQAKTAVHFIVAAGRHPERVYGTPWVTAQDQSKGAPRLQRAMDRPLTTCYR